MLVTAAAVLALFGTTLAAPKGDLVETLPGYKGKVAEQYSGYLDVSTKQGNVNFHYWLTPSQSPTAAKDPLVMWLNGGPGASSILFGFFGELGPYYLDDSSLANSSTPGVPDVYDNPWSWNRIANILFIETPGNVGYSFCENPDCRWDDTTGAEANYEALLKFYAEFPEYQENEFYITGESYGGMYVPSLVEQIQNGNGLVPLKGFAVGNGIIGHGDNFPNENGIHYEMLHNHAFISESQWEAIQAECAGWFKLSRGSPPASAACSALLTKASDTAGKFYVYDVYDTCGNDQIEGSTGTLDGLRAAYSTGGGPVEPGPGAYSPYGCGKNAVTKTWLGLETVRKALHVKPPVGNRWRGACSPDDASMCPPVAAGGQPDYEGNSYKYWHSGQNNTGWIYNQSRMDLLDVYPEFIAAYRTLIFNGDFDACVPYLHNERWTQYLAQQKGWKTTREWEAWSVDDQVAGYVTSYSGGTAPSIVENFTFATVKGSGHMVPQFQPKRGFELFKRFLENTL